MDGSRATVWRNRRSARTKPLTGHADSATATVMHQRWVALAVLDKSRPQPSDVLCYEVVGHPDLPFDAAAIAVGAPVREGRPHRLAGLLVRDPPCACDTHGDVTAPQPRML